MKTRTLLTVGTVALGAAIMACAETVCLETEQFADRGGWSVDSQFIDQMGSSFLLAHGMGKPVADAVTTFDCSEAGTYHVWARTRNWTAPWSEHAAGTFTVKVNGKELPNVLGRGTGDWQWQKAGEVTLEKGTASIALHDLTGFDGRCDVVYLSPVDGRPVMPAVRPLPPRRVKADLVVCGGGIAGTCAAIAAARLGLKVALVQDRPMLGGANSSEVRVHLGGYMNLGLYPRLGDVVAEIGPAKGGNAQPAARYEDQRKLDAVAAEKNIQLFLNTRVRWVNKKGDSIVSVTGQDVVTGERTEFEAPLFADCTGDACVGFLAGADFRMGRESKAETGEDMAPEKADKMTMGASVQWYTKDAGSAVAFPAEPWMIAFNEQNCEHGMRGDWDWETGMMRDQISEFERIRDYGMLVVYSNWSFLKNKSAKRAKYASREFAWVAYVAGKRESRRLMGDHILTQQDVFDFVPYPDGTCCTTWAIDLHYPMPRNTKHYDGEPFRSICTHNKHYAYPIPYRCLYSRNVANLFMAGRNISVTHVALGTTRVMRTTGMMGEVVGMAARVCKDRGCLPRGVYESHLGDLKKLMSKGVGTGVKQPPQTYNRGALISGTPDVKQAKERNKKVKEIIYVAADPFAVQLKQAVVKHLEERGFEVKDFGATAANPEKPYFESAVEFSRALTAADSPARRGILFCGTGMGMNMIANRFPGVRAAVVESVWAAKMCRTINDANVLCLGQMLWGEWMANAAVDTFLDTKFTEGLESLAPFLKEAAKKVEAIRP